MLPTPKVGDLISCKVYCPITKETVEYKNVRVVQPFPWLSNYEFCIPADGPAKELAGFKTRVIHMRSVVELNGHKVGESESSTQEVQVPASKGGSYTVVLQDGVGISCTCKGFQFRKSCRHLKEGEDAVK